MLGNLILCCNRRADAPHRQKTSNVANEAVYKIVAVSWFLFAIFQVIFG